VYNLKSGSRGEGRMFWIFLRSIASKESNLLRNLNEFVTFLHNRIGKRCLFFAKVYMNYENLLFTLNCARDPDLRSDSIFPGSRYAILIRKPGPVNAHSFLKLKLVWKKK
jgi:hypothetical protein